MGIDRDIAPEEQRHAVARASFLEHANGAVDSLLILGQEQHGHAIVAFGWEQMTAFLRLFTEEAMRHLKKDAGAVAGVLLEPNTTSVFEVHEHRQGIVDHLMRPLALEVGQSPDSAGIVLELGTIQSFSNALGCHETHHIAFPIS